MWAYECHRTDCRQENPQLPAAKGVGEKNATMESIEKIAIGLEIPLSQLFELLGGEKEEETVYAYRCYELVAAQEVRDQKQLYQIISEIEKYKKG